MRRRLWSLLTAAILALAAAGCAGGEAQTPQRGPGAGQAPAVPVTVATAVQKPMPLEIDVIGSAEAYSTVQVHAQVTGELTSVNFKEGDDVAKGQMLFTLDRRPLEAALQQAQANLKKDEAQLVNAKAQAQRYQDLVQRGIATREQVDQVTSNAAAMEATVGADRASVDNAKVQLDYATIYAPIAGRTGALMVHVGNLVRANDTQALVTINQVSPIYVSFAIPEAQLPDFRKYLAKGTVKVEAQAPNETAPASIGRVTFVDNAVDQTTGTIRIKGTFANEAHHLWPGQFVNVTLTLAVDPNAVVVPAPAVQLGQQGQYVFVVKPDKTVELRNVTVARSNGNEAIIQNGVKAGEIVVTDGQLRLVPGSRISVKGESPKATS